MRDRPLTPTEAGVWFTERLGGAGAVYAMPLSVTFDGEPDVPALAAAVDRVVARHPLLAAAVAERDGVPWFVPAPAGPPRLERQATEGFDLTQGPLCRFTLSEGRVLVVAHHLVFDGASKDVLVRDLATAYRGEVLPPLSDPAPADADTDAARDWWAGRWREPEEPVLPGLAGPVPAVATGEAIRFAIPHPLDTRDGSRFELLLASLLALLWRYGNEEPVVAVDLGTRTEADRDRIGLFVNELPVRTRPDPDEPFAAHLRRLRAELRELYRFRAVPLSRAVPGRKPVAALAPITLTYRRRAAAPEFGVPSTVDWSMFNGTARGALRVQVVDGPDGTEAMLQFAPGTLAPEAAERIAGHWLTLLRGAVNEPDTPLSRLPLLPPGERASVTAHDTGVQYPDATVPDLLAAQARRTPDATAVVADGTRLSYRELDAAVTRRADELRRHGAGPGAIVGVCLGRGTDLLVALLAVMRSGAAYLPLDPAHPAQRRALIVDDANTALVLTDDGITANAATAAGSPDRAYVIYTSGSTGRPKGVEIGHRALANLLFGMRDLLGAGPALRWLALTSPSFDISALELFLPLVVGGRVVIASDAEARDGMALRRLAETHAVTHIQATPSGWRLLLAADFAGTGVTALCGGEALPPALGRAVRARVSRLWNMYGPTETTIWSTAWEVPPDADEVSIGRPIANTRAYVLDAHGEPVPLGVPGELYLGGAGLAHGYLGRPELTGARFGTHPEFGRLYRTGDLVRREPDGRLTYLGRLDDQIKLRGYRIELGEIEARLLEHPAVAAAAVAVRPDEAGEPHLLACVVPATGELDTAALRAHLARTLPEPMLPRALVAVPALPLTPNGKLDRRALPQLPPTPAADPQPAPADELTGQVAAICAEVLRRDAVGAHDDLFDLGAHSLTITAISSRIRRRLGADLPLDLFFDEPTVAAIAAAVRAGR